MVVQILKVLPYPDASDPSLLIQIRIDYQPSYRILLGIFGTVSTQDEKRLATLEPMLDDQCKFEDILQPWGRSSSSGTLSRTLSYIVRLSQYGLTHIESLRQKERKKDVVLIFRFLTTYLQPEYSIASIKTVNLDQNRQSSILGTYDPRRPDKSLLLYEPAFQGAINDLPLLRPATAGNESIGRLTRDLDNGIEHIIKASDWVVDFAPVFGLGKSIIVEVPEIEAAASSDEIGQRINEAAKALPKMREELIKGNWTDCIENSRPILELLNKKGLLLEVLTNDGLAKDTAEALINGLSSTYEYASKFHHRIERDRKTISSPVKADKEDAYLAYLNAVSLVNLIAEKARKRSSSE
ncbi:MAG: hypothetical protein JRN15_13370 [Nitrososphaerota archaeon]|nr:hypothetical protein [Nitrososphaerota archaeon]